MEIMNQHKGFKHAIPRAHLLAQLRSQDFDIDDRFLRETYSRMLDRYPIGTSSHYGVFLCVEDSDLGISEADDKKRIAALHERITARRKSYYANRKAQQVFDYAP